MDHSGRPSLTFFWFALLIVVVSHGSAHGSLLTEVSFTSNVTGTGTLETVSGAATNTSIVAVTDPLALGLGSASGQTDYGIHRAVVDSTSVGDIIAALVSQSFGTVRSRWEDTITIGGGSGQDTAIVHIEIEGNLTSSGVNPSHQSSASVLFQWGFGGSMLWGDSARECPTCPLVSSNATFENGVLSAPFLFTYDTPFSIISDFTVNGTFGGDVNFGNTLTLSFELADNASISSDNDAVYQRTGATPVPESSSLPMLLTILGAGYVLRRRLAQE